MTRALLDVNVLIALLDQDHVHHVRAVEWLLQNAHWGWASCPLTQNGCVRIMSQSSYVNSVPPALVIDRLAGASANLSHEFWPDDITLLDASVVDGARVHGPRQVTDVYLLALAVQHGGRLATLDGAVPVSAVCGAGPEHLIVI